MAITPAPVRPVTRVDCRARALILWPGLDRGRLRRTNGEPERIARLVEQRTCLPREVIVAILTGQETAANS